MSSPNTPWFPVGHTNPLRGTRAAPSLQDRRGRPEGGRYRERAPGRTEAPEAYALTAASVAFQEHLLGSLTGASSPIETVLSRDIPSAAPAEIPATELAVAIGAAGTAWQR